MAAAKRKTRKSKETADWSWRLAGIALCAFFALGVMTGLSRSGRSLAQRVEAILHAMPRLSWLRPAAIAAAPAPRGGDGAIALVERTDGFYVLDAAGGLRGPVAPAAETDMAIISGPAASEPGPQLIEYASVMIRAEATLGLTVSEMRVTADGEATLYLERPAIPIAIDLAEPAIELERAAQILALWRGRRELIAGLDMTVADQGVVRVRIGATRPANPASGNRGGLTRTILRGDSPRPLPEASR
ncbi:MAG: hypothetical protein ACREQT_05695 [Candidatus Binataceae bacterium]